MMYSQFDCPKCKLYEWLREGNIDQCKLHGPLLHDEISRGDCKDFHSKRGKLVSKRRKK